MAGQNMWAERLAARVAGRPAPVEETTEEPVRPAWERVAIDRAVGRTPDSETVRQARAGARRPRTEWEQRLLVRLGHTDQNTDTNQEES
ncbi:hypothetical protein OG616_21450 [Streptomyces antibioticus]|uniref:hypothetical protein n=1 Tax=Streptomyces antibioticus TaxID=1890 RepID=UPI002254F810|nr:hypothetical protein [Streptomyces antibioticus]MCX5170561.1 hypothetical protein [Streptomyces antibioticus]